MKKVLTIAGSDSCGGAGIQADLKTFSALGTYGMSIITAVTAQNTQQVLDVQDISADIVRKQIKAIYDDISVDSVKIGMVSNANTIKTIAKSLKKYSAKNIVLDPVMISKSGYNLLKPDAKASLINELIPIATIITPNIPEAEEISNVKIDNIDDMKKAANKIYEMGPEFVLVKGGHMSDTANDVLFDGKDIKIYEGVKIRTQNTHGTGCTLSSAIAAYIALGHSVYDAVKLAKEYITIAIKHSFPIGKGHGPVHHFYLLYKKAGILE